MPTAWRIGLLTLLFTAAGRANANDPAAVAFFETKVRPVLAEHCFKCHGDQKPKGGLRLDSRAAVLAGGDQGPAVVPGKPDESRLLKAVRQGGDLKMPPQGKLTKQQVDDLARWVRTGAAWPDSDGAATVRKAAAFAVTDRDRDYWAFRPVNRPLLPSDGHPIDSFLLAKLEARGLTFSPPADRRELVRRAYVDLIGLPPTPEEVDAFVKDESADAWERLIDRLLASPHYGERWARHWLDVVRYAQTNGYERDDEKPNAWRYRDYVIKSLNDDKPYDRFVREQLAGDQLDAVTDDTLIATGFYRLGVWDDEPDDARQAVYDELDDVVSTAGQAFLGLTVGCARCHDHKFDPVSQKDYYGLLAYLHNIRPYEKPKADSSVTVALKAGVALAVREKPNPPAAVRVLIRGNAGTPGDEVRPAVPEVLRHLGVPRPDGEIPRRRALAEWVASPQNPLTARVIVNRAWLHHFGRGLVPTPNDFGKTGLPPTHPELLDWLADDFVTGGWTLKRLHKRIMTSAAYRMSSRAANQAALAADEGNALYWRQNPRRLEAEALRDAALAVSGRLNRGAGGRGVFPPLDREVLAGQSRPGLGWEVSPPAEQDRRSVYLFIKRTMLVPMLEAFDYNTTSSPVGERPVTTVAPQALMLLNSDFMQRQAEAFAVRLEKEAGPDPAAQVERAYRLALGRAPAAAERRVAAEYLKQQAEVIAAGRVPLTVRQLVPVSLSSGYLKALKPADFLAGPAEGWSYARGKWGNGYEGIEALDVARGPFALWQRRTFADARVDLSLTMHHASELAGVLLRAVPRGDVFEGYELLLDPRKGRLMLRRHDEKGVKDLATAEAVLPTREPHAARIELAGGTVRVWLNGAEKPVLEATDAEPLTRPGHFGLRTWGSALSCRDVFVAADGERTQVDPDRPPAAEEARRQALKSLCLVVLNLNEFAYVD